MTERIGIIGGGAWGTALGLVALRAGHTPLLWVREADIVEAINKVHENTLFLPGIRLDPGLRATGDLAKATENDLLLLAAPAQHLRGIAKALAISLKPGTPVVVCAKGIEEGSGALLSEVVADALPDAPCAILSGPTFAAEVAKGLPTAITLAVTDDELGPRLTAALGSRAFRPYLTDDLMGAQVGGAVKNVIAIACGVVAGKGLGENARAALITRGLAEMARLAAAKGGRPETLMGLSGLGDLALTCNSLQSRNHSLGVALGQGQSLSTILMQRHSVAEGVSSARACDALARRLGVDMPIVHAVSAILHDGANIETVIDGLLSRPFRGEPPLPLKPVL